MICTTTANDKSALSLAVVRQTLNAHACLTHLPIIVEHIDLLCAHIANAFRCDNMMNELVVPDAHAAIRMCNVHMLWQVLYMLIERDAVCLLCIINAHDRFGLTQLDYTVVYDCGECRISLEMFTDDKTPPPPPFDTFVCPICRELLWQPVSTTCQHHMCRTCFHDARCAGAFTNGTQCPVCRGLAALPLGYGTNQLIQYAIRKWYPHETSTMLAQVEHVRVTGNADDRFDRRMLALDALLDFISAACIGVPQKPLFDHNKTLQLGFIDADKTRTVNIALGEWPDTTKPPVSNLDTSTLVEGPFVDLGTPTMLRLTCDYLSAQYESVLHYAVMVHGNMTALRLGGRLACYVLRDRPASLCVMFLMRITVNVHTTQRTLIALLNNFLECALIIQNLLHFLAECVFTTLRRENFTSSSDDNNLYTLFDRFMDRSSRTLYSLCEPYLLRIHNTRKSSSCEKNALAPMTPPVHTRLLQVLNRFVREHFKLDAPVEARLQPAFRPLFPCFTYKLKSHLYAEYDSRRDCLLLINVHTKIVHSCRQDDDNAALPRPLSPQKFNEELQQLASNVRFTYISTGDRSITIWCSYNARFCPTRVFCIDNIQAHSDDALIHRLQILYHS